MLEPTLGHPAWAPYQDSLKQLPRGRFPEPSELQQILPADTQTRSGKAVQFVPEEDISRTLGYEGEIWRSGRVSTRRNSFHDFCNALVWSVFPKTKAALNALHHRENAEAREGSRGRLRDAITLFDECGLVVTSADRKFLDAIARHEWARVFGRCGEAWDESAQLWVLGHANLEKLINPYKAMTGNCLLLEVSTPPTALTLDAMITHQLLQTSALNTTRDLCPLPFMGAPGWWPLAAQDAHFYDDPDVFRAPRSGRTPAAVLSSSCRSRR